MKYNTSLYPTRTASLAEIKYIASLHNKKIRYSEQLFLAEGLRTCTTLIEYNTQLKSLYITEEMYDEVAPLPLNIPITIIGKKAMHTISCASTPSGIVGVFAFPPTPPATTLTPGLVLANITDPGNMGTLIRTACAIGIKSIVIVDGVDPFSPKVIQSTAGTIGGVTIFLWSWKTLCAQKKDIPLYALVVKDGELPQQQFLKNGLLVVGNEATGLPDEYINNCNAKITLPMPGGTESLNAAIAGAIGLYLAFVPLQKN